MSSVATWAEQPALARYLLRLEKGKKKGSRIFDSGGANSGGNNGPLARLRHALRSNESSTSDESPAPPSRARSDVFQAHELAPAPLQRTSSHAEPPRVPVSDAPSPSDAAAVLGKPRACGACGSLKVKARAKLDGKQCVWCARFANR